MRRLYFVDELSKISAEARPGQEETSLLMFVVNRGAEARRVAARRCYRVFDVLLLLVKGASLCLNCVT